MSSPDPTIDQPDKNGNTPLLSAVMNGDFETVKSLLQQGANIDFSVSRGDKEITPKTVAIQREKAAIQVTSSKAQKEFVKEITFDLFRRGSIAMGQPDDQIEYNVVDPTDTGLGRFFPWFDWEELSAVAIQADDRMKEQSLEQWREEKLMKEMKGKGKGREILVREMKGMEGKGRVIGGGKGFLG